MSGAFSIDDQRQNANVYLIIQHVINVLFNDTPLYGAYHTQVQPTRFDCT